MEGTIQVAARMVAAEARFIEWAMEAALCTQAEAEANTCITKHRLVVYGDKWPS